MKRYHMHIYRIKEKAEMNLDAKNEVEARLKALKRINTTKKKPKFKDSDCEFIVMEFEITGEDDK